MNEAIIKNFNETIDSNDHLYLLGDIFLGELEAGIELFKRLPGKKHLVWGNHDTDRRKEAMLNPLYDVVGTFGYAGMIKYKKWHFYFSHFPTCTTNFDDYQRPLGQRTLCLAGHTHSKELFEPCGSYNVAVDAHNCYPVSLEQIMEDFKEKYS